MTEPHALTRRFVEQHPEAGAAVLESLAPEAAAAYLSDLPAQLTATVLDAMTAFHAARCLARMPAEAAAASVAAMSATAAAGALRRCRRSDRETLLAHLPRRRAGELRTLLGYPVSTLGAWTDVGVAALPAGITAGEAWRRLRAEAQTLDRFLYVVSRDGRLAGRLASIELLRAEPTASVDELAGEVAGLPARTGLAAALEQPGWPHGDPMPVVSRDGHFLGVARLAVLTRADRAGETLRAHGSPGALVLELLEAYSAITARLLEASLGPAASRGRPDTRRHRP